MPLNDARVDHRRVLWHLVPLVFIMFGFGFALVPLYTVFCQLTGLNGKTGGRVAAPTLTADMNRVVTLELLGNVAAGLPWEFRPTVPKVRLHPGEPVTLTYRVHNRAHQSLVGRAVPSVAPGRAAPYVQKMECFCFANQRVGPGETIDMPVRLVIAPDLPPEIGTLSLSYTFFESAESPPDSGSFIEAWSRGETKERTR
jgi:cytochrome c oxidase assembly protein subunit 11